MNNKYKSFIKYIFIRLIRIVLSVFKCFPIKNNRVVFFSVPKFDYTCNPKYILDYLYKNYNNKFEYIWVNKDNSKEIPLYVKTCRFKSLKFFYYFLTARVIVSNAMGPSYCPISSNTHYIATWHGGGAYKKIELDVPDIKKDFWLCKRIMISTNSITHILSSCEKFSNLIETALKIKTNMVLKTGMPRNDIFFNKNIVSIYYEKVRKYYGLNKDTKIILYAPTWRNDFRNISDDLIKENERILKSLNERFSGNWVLFVRLHPTIKIRQYSYVNISIIETSNYVDMQELLCAADVLLNDYSSSMWDYSFLNRPCFIYAVDLLQYYNERNFYTSMSEWPFPIATNIDELINNILNFDQKEYIKKVEQHHKDLGSFENGRACEQVCKLIANIIDKG